MSSKINVNLNCFYDSFKTKHNKTYNDQYSSVQFSSVAQLCPTLCNPMNCSTPGLPVHHQLPSSPKPMSIELVMPSNHLIPCHPLLLLPSIFPSIRVFSNEWALHIRWPKYWSFSFNISPSNEQPGLISFRMDWLDQYSKSIQLILRLSKELMTESPLANQSYCPEANIKSFWSPSTY